MLDRETLESLVASEDIEIVLAVFPDMYGRLVGKRIMGEFFVNDVLGGELHACDYLLACDIEMEPIPGYQFTSWEQGYGDVRLHPDMNTLRICDWLDKTAIVLCDVYEETRDELVGIAPRTILRKQIDRALQNGYVAKAGSELEFYLFKDSYEQADQKGFIGLETASRYMEDYNILQGTKEEFVIGAIRRHIDRSGIPVEFSKGETGHGQQEINLRYAEFLEMADRHTIYKHAAKEIAWQKDTAITFMAKWDQSQAGSSMHIHVSLWDETANRPLFQGNDELGDLRVSPIFRWFLGGWMAHLREISVFYAPYPTSYKRYVAGSFAPTKIAWAHENRTAGFRIVGHGPSLRIECRIPGADANPYLAFAATLAAGLDGIENETEPPPPVVGDAYGMADLPSVPLTLNEAIRDLESSDWARQVFGDEVVNHYLHFFRTEQDQFDKVVTDWERARYFERA
jgi:glutamine synthetase